MEYSEVQKIAKDTIEYIKTRITAGMKLTDIRKLCEEKMPWFGDCGRLHSQAV